MFFFIDFLTLEYADRTKMRSSMSCAVNGVCSYIGLLHNIARFDKLKMKELTKLTEIFTQNYFHRVRIMVRKS